MKILQLVKTSDGAPWALQQMTELIKSGHEVHVAMPLGGKHTQAYKNAGIEVHDISYSLKRLITSIRQLRNIVNIVSPDLIHSHFYICTIIMRLGLRNYNTPRFFQLPGPSHLYYKFLKWLEICLAQKNLDYWIGACKFSVQSYLSSGVSENRVFLSYYQGEPVKEPEFTDQKKLRKEFGLPDSAILIGMISYMYPPKYYLGQRRGIKGHEDFIEAISIAAKANPNIYGLCIGGAWNGAIKYERKIHSFASSRTDHVIFCGSRNNVPEIYPELYCAVQPSHQENLGGAGQAFRYGCPIIATNTGGLPDLVIDGVTGYLVPVKNPEKLAEAILQMTKGPQHAHEMMLAGRKHYIALKENNKGSLERIYQNVLSKLKV